MQKFFDLLIFAVLSTVLYIYISQSLFFHVEIVKIVYLQTSLN